MNSENNTAPTLAAIRIAAMNLLARREHSAKELLTKLTSKFGVIDDIGEVIEKLTDDGLQSDLRFAEAFVRMRKRQGKGVVIIRAELHERGISQQIISSIMAEEGNWDDLALLAYHKKYGQHAVLDMKEKSKRVRFLTYRGFPSASISYVFSMLEEGANIDLDN